jgi:hypothetical protein
LQVHMFSVRGERLPHRFSLGPEVEEAGVEAAAVFRNGLALLTPAGHIWWVGGWVGGCVLMPLRLLIACCGAAGEAIYRQWPARAPRTCHCTATDASGSHVSPRRCVPNVHEPRLQHFPDPAPGLAGGAGLVGAGSGVHCIAVLPPSVSSSGALEVRCCGGGSTGSTGCAMQCSVGACFVPHPTPPHHHVPLHCRCHSAASATGDSRRG